MKKKCAAFLTAAIIFLSGCGNSYYEENIFAMDTVMTIKAYGDNAENAVKSACKKIEELNKSLSAESADSEISTVNNSAGTEVHVSPETASIISEAIRYSEITDGALDISVYPLVREWGFTSGEYKIPDNERIGELLGNVGYDKIEINGNSVFLAENQMIDLGSVAKGYASDKVREILKESGISSALINLGGNIMTVGNKPDGNKWNIAVTNPFSPDEYTCSVKVSDKAVVTSGDYQRYFTADDGTRYCHIIDPKTGCPAKSGIVSATIIGDSGTMCDALSTAVFVMGTEKAEELWRDSHCYDMILITGGGEIIVTEDIEADMTYFGGNENVRVLRK